MRDKIVNAIASVRNRTHNRVCAAVTQVRSRRAEGYVDSGVKILIAVVIGALLLAGLYALFNSSIMPTVTAKVQSLFNYGN